MQTLAPILVLAALTIGTSAYPVLKRRYAIWRCHRFLRHLPQQGAPTWRIDYPPSSDKNGGTW